MKKDRREFLTAGAAALVAASVPLAAAAQDEKEFDAEGRSRPLPIYLNGCGWNRNLPGVFGQACFAFEARAELGGTGVGTIRDDVHPEVNSQFQITEAISLRQNEYRFRGPIIASRSPEMVGMIVTIDADSLGNGRGRASMTVETEGNNLVVIAIIAVLIGLLLPAVQAR